MKRTTVEYYKLAVKQARSAREAIEKAEAEYTQWSGAAKEELDADLIGAEGYKTRLEELRKKRDGKIGAAQESVLAVAKEFETEMNEAAMLDGGKIDDDALRILNSGLSLTLSDWEQLGERYKDNWIMSRLLQQRYDENPCFKEKGNGLMGTEGKEKVSLKFGTDPMKRAEIFSSFTDLIAHTAKSGTVLTGYKDQDSYWNYLARESLKNIKTSSDESFDTIETDFPVEYVQAKPRVW